jgi:hypothetical protein
VSQPAGKHVSDHSGTIVNARGRNRMVLGRTVTSKTDKGG